jgi:uncharacterized protein YndB with AHSA1/START domain
MSPTTEGKNQVGKEFVITRDYDAPRERVWRACTEAKLLAQWWGPRGFTAPICEWHALPGNKIYVVMRAPNGTDYPMGGLFHEVVAPEKLVTTTGALDDNGNLMFEFHHTLTLLEQEGKTRLTMRSRLIRVIAPDAAKYIGGFEVGMTQSLERLGEAMAKIPFITERVLLENIDREIFLSRDFAAPRELVWEAMVNPKHVVNWWGPHGFSMTIEKMDFRVGGEWHHVMRGPDGVNYPNHSIFQEIVKPEKIVFSHGGQREGGPGVSFVSTWSFEKLAADKTRVSIRMVFPSAAERDRVAKEFGAIEGGQQTLARLGDYLPKVK